MMAGNEIERVVKMTRDDLCDYLDGKGLDHEAVDTLKRNRLCGATLLKHERAKGNYISQDGKLYVVNYCPLTLLCKGNKGLHVTVKDHRS